MVSAPHILSSLCPWSREGGWRTEEGWGAWVCLALALRSVVVTSSQWRCPTAFPSFLWEERTTYFDYILCSANFLFWAWLLFLCYVLEQFSESVIAPYEFFHSEILCHILRLTHRTLIFKWFAFLNSIQMRAQTLAHTIFWKIIDLRKSYSL